MKTVMAMTKSAVISVMAIATRVEKGIWFD